MDLLLRRAGLRGEKISLQCIFFMVIPETGAAIRRNRPMQKEECRFRPILTFDQLFSQLLGTVHYEYRTKNPMMYSNIVQQQ